MKIGLIHPLYTYDENRNNRPFPFGVAYIASYLRKNGHDAAILDLNVNYMKKDAVVAALKNMRCDMFGISALSGAFTYVKALAGLIKDNFDVPVVVGGPLGTHSPEVVLKHTKADICVIGQGEHVIKDLLNDPGNLKAVKGIVYRDGSGLPVKNADAGLLPLDEIPWPAYEIMNVEEYIWDGAAPDMDSKRRYQDIRMIQMITGRGCPMGCNFCSKVLGRRFLLRKVDDVVNEIKFMISKYRINGVYFRDELYLMNREHAYDLSSRLKELKIIWMGQARVDRVDYELLKHMKECGCISLGFGIESGSQRLLKLMNKYQTVQQIENAVRMCYKLDLDMKVQLVLGYPGEDRQTIEETVELFRRLGHPGRRFHLITPLPGSYLYDDLRARGVIKDEFAYLTELSRRESGFSKGKPLLNLTSFSDDELLNIKRDTERRMEENYRRYLWRHPVEIYRYFRDRLIYKRYLFRPFFLLGKIFGIQRLFGLGKASDTSSRNKKLWLEHQL